MRNYIIINVRKYIIQKLDNTYQKQSGLKVAFIPYNIISRTNNPILDMITICAVLS